MKEDSNTDPIQTIKSSAQRDWKPFVHSVLKPAVCALNLEEKAYWIHEEEGELHSLTKGWSRNAVHLSKYKDSYEVWVQNEDGFLSLRTFSELDQAIEEFLFRFQLEEQTAAFLKKLAEICGQ
ncbi:MAG: hypothetical protein ACLUYS_04900 [Allobaculum sp.]|uniref:hypothetical protein n=1 Tax=Allobaculum sp. TaxID=1872463 RepID=UPI00399A9B4D